MLKQYDSGIGFDSRTYIKVASLVAKSRLASASRFPLDSYQHADMY